MSKTLWLGAFIGCMIAICTPLYYGAKANHERVVAATKDPSIVYKVEPYQPGTVTVRRFETEDGTFYLVTAGYNAVSIIKIK